MDGEAEDQLLTWMMEDRIGGTGYDADWSATLKPLTYEIRDSSSEDDGDSQMGIGPAPQGQCTEIYSEEPGTQGHVGW
jgi:hypothetical protein